MTWRGVTRRGVRCGEARRGGGEARRGEAWRRVTRRGEARRRRWRRSNERSSGEPDRSAVSVSFSLWGLKDPCCLPALLRTICLTIFDVPSESFRSRFEITLVSATPNDWAATRPPWAFGQYCLQMGPYQCLLDTAWCGARVNFFWLEMAGLAGTGTGTMASPFAVCLVCL